MFDLKTWRSTRQVFDNSDCLFCFRLVSGLKWITGGNSFFFVGKQLRNLAAQTDGKRRKTLEKYVSKVEMVKSQGSIVRIVSNKNKNYMKQPCLN